VRQIHLTNLPAFGSHGGLQQRCSFRGQWGSLWVGSNISQRACMRSFFEWHPIEEAPLDEDVELFVTDVYGSFYGLRYPCRRTADGWVSSVSGKALKVRPVQWKPVNRTRG
jgi:hypothetical protein